MFFGQDILVLSWAWRMKTGRIDCTVEGVHRHQQSCETCVTRAEAETPSRIWATMVLVRTVRASYPEYLSDW
jgi:hypothetical protein